jgi:DNA repair protein REV1
VSRAIYAIFFQEADLVQPVSCDEAFLELRPGSDGAAAARRIRERIMAETRCPASAGVSCNMLLARIATKRAKPNGQCVLGLGEAQAYLEGLAVDELPGVGWAMSQQLEERGIKTCGQLRAYSLGQLQDWFGGKVGKRLHEACRGIDQRQVR